MQGIGHAFAQYIGFIPPQCWNRDTRFHTDMGVLHATGTGILQRGYKVEWFLFRVVVNAHTGRDLVKAGDERIAVAGIFHRCKNQAKTGSALPQPR